MEVHHGTSYRGLGTFLITAKGGWGLGQKYFTVLAHAHMHVHVHVCLYVYVHVYVYVNAHVHNDSSGHS